MPTHCLISFGSNLGDRDAVVACAARLIDRSGLMVRARDFSGSMGATAPATTGLQTSRLFETPPIGGPEGQSPFLNAVAAFVTTASAAEVLDVLQRTEDELGRLRKDRWGARSIDLDVVLHGEICGARSAGLRGLIGGRGPWGSTKALVVPHPRYTARRFVIVPACDVAADFVDPRFGWTLADLAAHLDAGPPSMALVGGDRNLRQMICERLAEQHCIAVVDAEAIAMQSPCVANRWDPARPWVSPTVPLSLLADIPPRRSGKKPLRPNAPIGLPRLITRIERTSVSSRWPAPHRIWPASGRWPEYRLEVDDLDWAVQEIASALDSMRCQVRPVTEDGNWWKS